MPTADFTHIGCDPELFVVKTADKYSSAVPPVAWIEDYGINPIAKNHLHKNVFIKDEHFSIIEDGAAAEINVTPSIEAHVFAKKLVSAISFLTSFVKMNFPENHAVVINPAVNFDTDEYWKDRGPRFKDCVRFGCDPDLDIYTGQYSVEINVEKITKRYGGGHLHMQAPLYNVNFFEENFYLVTRLFDTIVGCLCTALPRNSEIKAGEFERLKFYGRPGRIRLQNYPDGTKGIEYRTPSNFWISGSSTCYSNILFDAMQIVFRLMQNEEDALQIINLDEDMRIPNCIVQGDEVACFVFLQRIFERLVYMNYASGHEFQNFY